MSMGYYLVAHEEVAQDRALSSPRVIMTREMA
jgi:hypothetical protein